MYIIVGIMAFLCVGCLYEHISGKSKMSTKGIVICSVLGISMVIVFFVMVFDSGSSNSIRYEMIENEDGTIKYYDTDKWKETDDGKHIYDDYGNVKDK